LSTCATRTSTARSLIATMNHMRPAHPARCSAPRLHPLAPHVPVGRNPHGTRPRSPTAVVTVARTRLRRCRRGRGSARVSAHAFAATITSLTQARTMRRCPNTPSRTVWRGQTHPWRDHTCPRSRWK
jgi:hypothetical protein